MFTPPTETSPMAPARRARRALESSVFFPAAAAFAALAVPLWIARQQGLVDWPGAATPRLHAHEMVFGFALAVVAGFLLARSRGRTVAGLLTLWLIARLEGLGVPLLPAVADGAGVAFALLLAVLAGWPIVRAAKRPRNAAIAAILVVFPAAEVLGLLDRRGLVETGATALAIDGIAIDGIAILLFMMGGRIIAAASSGAIQRLGDHLPDVAHAGLERAGLVALALMLALDAVGMPAPAGIAAALAGFAALARLIRWQAWRLWRTPEVAVLHLGYGWLAGGLLLKGLAQGAGLLPVAQAVHGLGVGALGTLALAVMARVALQRRGHAPAMPSILKLAAALVSAAAILRLTAAGPMVDAFYVAAGACWALALGAAFAFLVRVLTLAPTPPVARPHRRP